MALVGLGSRTVTAAADQTGLNPGQLTSEFGPDVLAVTVPWYEIYRGVVIGSTPGAYASVFIDSNPVSWNFFGDGAEWDPSQPPLLQPGQSVYFFWSLASTAAAPTTTLWLRYDDNQGTS